MSEEGWLYQTPTNASHHFINTVSHSNMFQLLKGHLQGV